MVIASWDFTGRLPAWRSDFPDFDCRRRAEGGMAMWDDLRTSVEEAPQEAWPSLAAAAAARADLGGALAGLVEEGRAPECPLGVLFVAAALYGQCAEAAAAAAATPGSKRSPTCAASDEASLSDLAQRLFRATTVETLLGTRWPLLALFDDLRLPPYADDPDLTCEGLAQPILDWPRLRAAFLPEGDWFHQAKALVYSRGFQAQWMHAVGECTYGFAMVALWKLVICAETQAECVSQYSLLVDDLIKNNDWREVTGNSWPVFGFLSRVQGGIMRHEYKLDFTPEELQGRIRGFPQQPVLFAPPARPASAEAEAEDPLLLAPGRSPAFAAALAAVLAGLPRSYVAHARGGGGMEVRRLLYVTMVFGPRYVPYIPRFMARAEAVGIANLALFCLDEAAMAACQALPGSQRDGRCIPGTPSILNKFTLPLVFLHLGVDVFWLDFDIFLLRDPTRLVLDTAQRREVDLLVSGSFADDCICSGLAFFRATQVVSDWLLTVLSWMYEHVYTHDQQSFSAFLAGRPDEDNATTPERISSLKLFRMYLHPEVPRWALLDPVVEFVSARVLNTTGWTGNLEDMFIFHFLHGDSEVNKGHSAYGWNAAHGFSGGAGPDRALLDIFYDQADEDLYTEASPPAYERSGEIREALMASWRPSRPSEMLHCGVLQLNPYSPGRMSAEG